MSSMRSITWATLAKDHPAWSGARRTPSNSMLFFSLSGRRDFQLLFRSERGRVA